VFGYIREQVDRFTIEVGSALTHDARPGHVFVDGGLLCGRVEMGEALIGQDGEDGFFVQQFAAERVDDEYIAVAHGTHEWGIQPEAVEQFAGQDALVDDVDGVSLGTQGCAVVVEGAGVSPDGGVALAFEVVAQDFVFGACRDAFPIDTS